MILISTARNLTVIQESLDRASYFSFVRTNDIGKLVKILVQRLRGRWGGIENRHHVHRARGFQSVKRCSRVDLELTQHDLHGTEVKGQVTDVCFAFKFTVRSEKTLERLMTSAALSMSDADRSRFAPATITMTLLPESSTVIGATPVDDLSVTDKCSGKWCCDRKSRAACAQSFAPWQQATIEIMRRNLSYYCLLALHI